MNFEDLRTLSTIEGELEEKVKRGRPGLDEHGVDINRAMKESTFFTISDASKDIPLPPSAKTTAVKDIVLTCLKEAPDDNIISESTSIQSRLEQRS
jgi:hypothetical protein